MGKVFSIEGCERSDKMSRGWCYLHYERWRWHGDPLYERTAARRFWAKVNSNGPTPDYAPELGPCWIWNGGTTDLGYGRFFDGSSMVGPHRFCYELLVSPVPKDLHIE